MHICNGEFLTVALKGGVGILTINIFAVRNPLVCTPPPRLHIDRWLYFGDVDFKQSIKCFL